ncbi:hypothetical protein M231_02903 [Tremella mesenterica]|uniref:Phytase n=1 Tax=Tremella mesenterica TaxID=5217 RepID=A0A4Q1BPK7_TREME|nr:hypothetical protein M231_02903 [Tremella mesenterica]
MLLSALVATCLLTPSSAAPIDGQTPLLSPTIHNDLDPLKHLSAISPFYIPFEQPDPLPPHCSLTRVSLLIRHSAIMGNDDEFEQTMSPFIQKIHNITISEPRLLPSSGPWAFLRQWETPIVEKTLEKISPRGRKDAKQLGKYIRKQYNSLFPPRTRRGSNSQTSKEGVDAETKGGKPSYKVWTASSGRDIDTAKAYILGSFPSHQSGDDGEGDGDVVQLIEVPNHAKEWEKSLTPHKACDRFEKESSLKPANQWLAVYAPRVRQRLRKHIPDLVERLNDQDILAMQMLCGYETIAAGKSPFCHVFTDSEWLDVEYYFDVRFHYMMGYGSPLAPYLGMPWVKTAKHLLEGEGDDGKGDHLVYEGLHPHFTHRESPAFVSTFLNLFNSTRLPHPASEEPPLDRRVDNRQWRTSHISSFLGHIALERFSCKPTFSKPMLSSLTSEIDVEAGVESQSSHKKKEDYVRAVVNGKHEIMYGCQDGVEGSCKWETFREWVDKRGEKWGDWAGVCNK